MSQDNRQAWFARVVESGLQNEIFNPADVLAHATPDVLASHLPPELLSKVLQASLEEVPEKLQLMARTGSYGSWFNFYVCGMEVRLKVLGGVLYLGTPAVASNEADSVCAEADVTPEDFEGTAR